MKHELYNGNLIKMSGVSVEHNETTLKNNEEIISFHKLNLTITFKDIYYCRVVIKNTYKISFTT